VDKIITVLKYCGPQTYNDFLSHGFQGEEIELDQLVFKGILVKKNDIFDMQNSKLLIYY